jgi:hypothetical protein
MVGEVPDYGVDSEWSDNKMSFGNNLRTYIHSLVCLAQVCQCIESIPRSFLSWTPRSQRPQPFVPLEWFLLLVSSCTRSSFLPT